MHEGEFLLKRHFCPNWINFLRNDPKQDDYKKSNVKFVQFWCFFKRQCKTGYTSNSNCVENFDVNTVEYCAESMNKRSMLFIQITHLNFFRTLWKIH